MKCLLLGRGESDARQRINGVLETCDYELLCCDRMKDAELLFTRYTPNLVLFTYLDNGVIKFVDWGAQRNDATVWAAVLDHEPEISLKQLMASGIDDLITPPLTDFRLESRLKFIIRNARIRTERNLIEEALAASNERARAVLETTVDGIVTINERGIIETFNKAAEYIFGYTAAEAIGQNVNILMPFPHREEHDGFMRSYHETGHKQIIGVGREVKGQRKNGEIFPIELSVSEIFPNGQRTYTGVIRDISSRRYLEQELLATSEKERRRIGQDLHDGLGQMLTGIGLIAQNLARKLQNRNIPESEDLFELVDLIKDADEQARTLARTLIPIELENGGLKAAITRLGKNINLLYGLHCSVEEVGEAPIPDASVATHFYRIIQEAMNNAARHSEATQIKVSIAGNKDQIRVRIQDNGKGIKKAAENSRGMGLRIMQYRANVIGASLDIRAGSESGTIVTCTVPIETSIPMVA